MAANRLAALDAMMDADPEEEESDAQSYNGAWSVAESEGTGGFPVALMDSPAKLDEGDPVLDPATVPDEPDAPRPETLLVGTDHDYQVQLFTIIQLGQRDQLPWVVKVGADVNLPDDTGRPPLMFAAQLGQVGCLEQLLQLGADVNGKDRLGNTALHIAARDASSDMTLLLLRSGAGTEAQVDVDAQSYAGRTPLHNAASAGCLPIVEFLCEAGCTLDSQVVAPNTEDHDKSAEELAEARSGKVGDDHDLCMDEIGRVRRLRGTLVEPEEPPEIQQMRAALAGLEHRVQQLEESIATKETEIRDDVQRSQEYVEVSERIAMELGAAATADELERLSDESTRIVESAASTAANITLRKAEASGLRAELAETNKDAVDSIRAIADLEARAKLGHQTRVAEHRIVQKDRETRLMDLQIKQLKRELTRHVTQSGELRAYISDGHAKFLHKSAAERAELEAEYEVTMKRLAELEGAMPRALDRTDMYETRVGKLRTQLAEVNATVAQALQSGAEGETRAAMAEENAMQIQQDMVEAEKATKFALTQKKMAEVSAEDADLASQQAAERAENSQMELTKVRTMARNTEHRLKMAENQIKKLKEDTKKLASAELRMQRAEKAAKAENKRAEGLRKERNSFERQLQQADERIRELEGTFNGGQADWWQKKLAQSEKWTKRRERFYETNQDMVLVADKKELDDNWSAINTMTRAVDVSLRRTCGQLKLRNIAVQTDTTWYPGRDKVEEKVRAIPMAGLDSAGERHAWEELVRVKELEREATHDKCLQHEKTIREQVVLLRNLRTSESRLKNFKKTFGPRIEKDKSRIYELEDELQDLNRMVNDPNPALKGVHEVLKASEEAHVASKQLADKAVVVAKVAANIPIIMEVERPTTPPSLRELVFQFQNTGRKVGITWGKRQRHGTDEVFVERVEEAGQALRQGVPEGFVLKRVKHARGQPDITKLKFSAIINVLDAGLQYSPLEVTLTEPPSDETLMANSEHGKKLKGKEEAEAKAKALRDKESKVIVPVPVVAKKPLAIAHTTRGVPRLPSIAGPHGRQNILRQLAYAANEQEKLAPPSDEEGEDGDATATVAAAGEGGDGAQKQIESGGGSRPSSRSGSRSRPSSAQLAPIEKESAAGAAEAADTAIVPIQNIQPIPGLEGLMPTKTSGKKKKDEDADKEAAKKKKKGGKLVKAKKKAVATRDTSVEDNQFAITALSKSEDARQREAKRNVDLQQRLEKMSIDLVVNAEMVSTLQEELVKAETLAAQELHTVAEEQRREEAVVKRNAVASGLLRAVTDLAGRLIDDLQTLNRDQLAAATSQLLGAKQKEKEASGAKETSTDTSKGTSGRETGAPALKAKVSAPVVSDQEVSDYAVVKLGMDVTSLQDMEWLARAALSVTLADGWVVSRDPTAGKKPKRVAGRPAPRPRKGGGKSGAEKAKAPFVYLNAKDGRVMEKHPMEQKCQKIQLNLMRWSGLRKQAMAVVDTPATALIAVRQQDDGDGEEEDIEEIEEEM